MSIKSLLVAALLLAGPLAAFSQTFKLDWTDETKLKGGINKAQVTTLGKVDGRLYLLADETTLESGRQLRLISYAEDLSDFKSTTVYTTNLKTTNNGIASHYLNVKTKRLYFLLRTITPALKKVELSIREYDLLGNKLGENRNLGEVFVTPNSFNSFNSSASRIAFSEDSSKAVFCQELSGKSKEAASFSLAVMPTDFSKIEWQREVIVPYNRKESDILSTTLSNDGTVYMLAYLKEKTALKTSGNAKYYYTLFRIKPEGPPTEVVVKLGTQEIESLDVTIDDDNNLRCTGFYGPKNATRNSSGFFSFKLSPDGNEPFDKFEQIVPDLYGNVANGKKLEYNYRNTFLRPDGGQVVLGEQFRLKIVQNNNIGFGVGPVGVTRYTTHYYYGPISVINLGPTNTIEWVTRVPKLQHTKDDNGYFSSFYSTTYKDKLVILYNDDPDNLNVVEDKQNNDLEQARTMKTSAIYAATINRDGKLSKQIIAKNGGRGDEGGDDLGVTLIPHQQIRIDESRYLVMARWRKSIRLGLLTITD